MKKIILFALLIFTALVLESCNGSDDTFDNMTTLLTSYEETTEEKTNYITENSVIYDTNNIENKCQEDSEDSEDMSNYEFYPFNEDGWIISDFPEENDSIRDINNENAYDIGNIIKSANDVVWGIKKEYKSYAFFEDDLGVIIGRYGGELRPSWLVYIERGYDLDKNESYLESYIINDRLIEDIFEYNKSIYYIRGSAFGTHGGIGKLEKVNNIWTEVLDIELNEAIYGYLIDNDNLYIVTRSRLLLFKNDKIENVLIHSDMSIFVSMHPISIAKLKDSIYIGGKGGVISYNIDTEEVLWWMKK